MLSELEHIHVHVFMNDGAFICVKLTDIGRFSHVLASLLGHFFEVFHCLGFEEQRTE
jgi:hypothetical protein